MEWVEGYEERYIVTPYGEIYSIHFHRFLKKKTDRYGYSIVALTKNGKTQHIPVHRLVAKAYVPNPLGKPCVNHIDEDKLNNHYTNLEWVTAAENDNFGTRSKRMAQSKSKKPVICLLPDGTVIHYSGVKDASRKTGIAHSLISRYCQGKPSAKYNMIWRYANESH